MARHKEFDRDAALMKAVEVFWDKGYDGTSTDDLVRAMGIGRQSMYDTFGDKHALFVSALTRYRDDERHALHTCLRDATSPLGAIESFFYAIAAERPVERARGCLMIAATAELAAVDPEIAQIARENGLRCETSFAHAVAAAVEKGEIKKGIDPHAAGRFLWTTFLGMKLSAKAGASPESLRDTARFALSALPR
jgi:TetR/AcrR family transcriptional regulator, transcriptional repressor for nem operon